MSFITFLLGLIVYFVVRVVIGGFFTVRPDERAVKTSFGRAARLSGPPASDPTLSEDEQQRYRYPQLQVIPPGGPYLRLPWQRVHKVSVATQSVDIVWDPTKSQDTIEAVTKDNLTTGVNGQIRHKGRAQLLALAAASLCLGALGFGLPFWAALVALSAMVERPVLTDVSMIESVSRRTSSQV